VSGEFVVYVTEHIDKTLADASLVFERSLELIQALL
jgi:hypothetical protein